jgi:hypothetical protein
VSVINGLGDRWLCPDCGRVLDRPPYRYGENERRWHGQPIKPGYYHSFKCGQPMVRCVVILGGAS